MDRKEVTYNLRLVIYQILQINGIINVSCTNDYENIRKFTKGYKIVLDDL